MISGSCYVRARVQGLRELKLRQSLGEKETRGVCVCACVYVCVDGAYVYLCEPWIPSPHGCHTEKCILSSHARLGPQCGLTRMSRPGPVSQARGDLRQSVKARAQQLLHAEGAMMIESCDVLIQAQLALAHAVIFIAFRPEVARQSDLLADWISALEQRIAPVLAFVVQDLEASVRAIRVTW